MRILIVGGAGYIGSHVVVEAIERGFDVTIFDDLSTGFKSNLSKDVHFIEGSTLSILDLENLFSLKKYDVVIHLAACKSAGDSMLNPTIYSKNNIIGGINLLNFCVKHNVNSFIFSSSAAVYGSPKYVPINESHPLNPINYYGFTKLLIEQNLKWYSLIHKLKFASLRYFNAAGYDINGRLNRKEINPQNLIPVVMETAIGQRKEVEIYGNDYKTKDGTGVRDYVHVNDLAKAHIDSIEYISKNKKNLIVNLGAEKGYSVLEIIEKIKDVSKNNIVTKLSRRRKGDSAIVVSKTTLAKKLIGWDPQYSDLDTLIKSTWKVYQYY